MSDIEMAEFDDDDDLDITDTKGLLSGSEEGEINDSDSDDGPAQIKKENDTDNTVKKYSFQTEGNDSINRSIFDDVDLAKMEERANRFGFDKESDIKILEKEKTDLYESLSINTQEDLRHARLDTIHVYGTHKMKTNDIFEYFFAHKPLFLEWIDESSCNVVWKDDISAAKAMVFYSKEILLYSEDDMNMNEDNCRNTKPGDAVQGADIKVPIPPGKWRAGAPHPQAEFLFLRFANKSDKKASGTEKLKVMSSKYKDNIDSENIKSGLISESMKNKIKMMKRNHLSSEEEKNKNPWGELCQTWGINDSQEVFGVPNPRISHSVLPPLGGVRERIGNLGPLRINPPLASRLSLPFRSERTDVKTRLGKRTQEVIDIEDSSQSDEEESQSSDEEWTTKRKVPRMRMHADDEQEKMKKTINSNDLVSSQWEDELNINNIMVEVKNEGAEVPCDPVDTETRTNTKSTSNNDLRSRIGRRRNSTNSDSDNSSSSPPREHSKTNVWSRLDISNKKTSSKPNSDSETRDLRHTLKKSISTKTPNRPGFHNPDLRSRLGKKAEFRASPLRIEVDNEHYAPSDDE